MKIIFVVDSMNNGGAERVIANLSNNLILKNDIIIINVSGKEKKTFYRLDDKIKYLFIQGNFDKKVMPLKKIVLLRGILKQEKPHIVISFLSHINIFTHFAIIGLNQPHIVSERNNPNVEPNRKIIKFLKEYVFKKSDGAVFQTNDAMIYYDKYKIKNKIIIKNPLISGEIKRDNCEKFIINTGRLTNQKNQKMLIDAFDLFYITHRDFKLKIYGVGELEEQLKNYVKTKKCVYNIQFIGVSKTWLEESKNASMFVLSSDYEGMPNALIEAMSVGIPCISTDCPIGGSREVIIDGINGFLSPVGDSEALSKRMSILADNSELNKRFSKESIKINDRLEIEKIANQWIQFIEKVIFDYKERHSK